MNYAPYYFPALPAADENKLPTGLRFVPATKLVVFIYDRHDAVQ